MNEYRIVKDEIINGDNKTKESFIIQKKYFCFWINYRFKIHYYTNHDWNGTPCHGAMLKRYVYTLNSVEDAEKYIKMLDFNEIYKGNKIGIIFTPGDLKTQYINWSCYRFFDDRFCYEFSESIEKIKENIDGRISKRRRSIIRL